MLHVAAAAEPRDPRAPLVLYASGDGGWFGTAVGMFRAIADGGLDVVGFSSRALMRIVQSTPGPPTPEHLVAAYASIVDAVRRDLALPPETPVVLTGWSRGASLGVLVAGSSPVTSQVRGVVAVGLAARDHLGLAAGTDDDPTDTDLAHVAAAREGDIDMYARIARIAPRRCVVIQASQDGYLPADRARALFGVDSEIKRIVTIDATNHRFHGGETAFLEAFRSAIRWVATSVGQSGITSTSRDGGHGN
jgi:hypothetical protein